ASRSCTTDAGRPYRSRPRPRTARRRAVPLPARTARSTGRATSDRTATPRARAPPRARRATGARAGSRVPLLSRFGASRLGRRVLEPVRPALALPAHRVEVCLLDCERDGTRRPDRLIVDLAQWRHLGGGAGHEHLFREVEVGADQLLLNDGVPEVLCDLDDRVASDPRQDRGGQVGCVDRPVPYE